MGEERTPTQVNAPPASPVNLGRDEIIPFGACRLMATRAWNYVKNRRTVEPRPALGLAPACLVELLVK